MTTKTKTTKSDVQRQIAEQVNVAWPTFAAAHPALAAVLDQSVIREHVTDSLMADPSFQKAYAAAVVANAELKATAEVVRTFADRVMATMG